MMRLTRDRHKNIKQKSPVKKKRFHTSRGQRRREFVVTVVDAVVDDSKQNHVISAPL